MPLLYPGQRLRHHEHHLGGLDPHPSALRGVGYHPGKSPPLTPLPPPPASFHQVPGVLYPSTHTRVSTRWRYGDLQAAPRAVHSGALQRLIVRCDALPSLCYDSAPLDGRYGPHVRPSVRCGPRSATLLHLCLLRCTTRVRPPSRQWPPRNASPAALCSSHAIHRCLRFPLPSFPLSHCRSSWRWPDGLGGRVAWEGGSMSGWHLGWHPGAQALRCRNAITMQSVSYHVSLLSCDRVSAPLCPPIARPLGVPQSLTRATAAPSTLTSFMRARSKGEPSLHIWIPSPHCTCGTPSRRDAQK